MLLNIHTHNYPTSDFEIYNSNLEPLEAYHFSSGVHPWDSQSFDNQVIEQLNILAKMNACVAIGEIGLDKTKGPSMAEQVFCFEKQVAIAERNQLPVIIHCVRSWNELKVLKRKLAPSVPWIYHGFTKHKLLDEVLEEGFYISLGSSILKNDQLLNSLKSVPLDRILFETDDKTIDIVSIYEAFSKLKNIPLPLLQKQIENNVKTIFPKWTTGLKELNF